MRFTNPIIPGSYPDPSICRVGQEYYLVNSSFEYFPGAPIFHSRDLVHWRQIGHCLTRPSQLDLSGTPLVGGIFAPTIRYHRGTFYMITTLVEANRHFVVTATDPAGPWSDPIWIDQGGFDPSLLFLDNGQTLLTWSQSSNSVSAIMQSEIDLATGATLSPARLIWTGTGGQYPEGPHLYHLFNRYYLLIAEGGTDYGHMVTIARSDSPWGPFESCRRNPILTHRSTAHPIQAVGHADLIEAHDGSWWMVMLGVRPFGYPQHHHLGRETFLAPVVWDNDAWPIVGEAGRIALEMEAPAFAGSRETEVALRDDFDHPTLSPYWNFVRTPHDGDWSLTERPGWLRLACTPMTLDDPAPAFVGRRQEHMTCSVRARLDFTPQSEGDEAGVTVLMNAQHHYEIAVVARQSGGRALLVRRRIGTLSALVAQHDLPDGPIDITIDATPAAYAFGWMPSSGACEILAAGETRYLATETAGGFTGVYIGLYATGQGRHSSTVADFDWFQYIPN